MSSSTEREPSSAPLFTSAENLRQSCVYVEQNSSFDTIMEAFGQNAEEDDKQINALLERNYEWSRSARISKARTFSEQKYEKCPLFLVETSTGVDNIHPLTSIRGFTKSLCVYERSIPYGVDRRVVQTICPAK
jgi:hypothetical protein